MPEIKPKLREHVKKKLAFLAEASAEGGGVDIPLPASKKSSFFSQHKKAYIYRLLIYRLQMRRYTYEYVCIVIHYFVNAPFSHFL